MITRHLAAIIGISIVCKIVGCRGVSPGSTMEHELTIIRKSDNTVILHSAPIQHLIVDDCGGLVIPLSEADRKEVEKATSAPAAIGDTAVFSISGHVIGEIRIIAGFANPFIYLRGDFAQLVRRMENGRTRVIHVDEVPLSSAEVAVVLEQHR